MGVDVSAGLLPPDDTEALERAFVERLQSTEVSYREWPLDQKDEVIGEVRARTGRAASREVVLFSALSRWMSGRKETDAFYFLTEYIGAEPTAYVIYRSSLTEAELSAINNARQNVFVGVNGDWAVFMDHDGGLHVAGPAKLYDVLKVLPPST